MSKENPTLADVIVVIEWLAGRITELEDKVDTLFTLHSIKTKDKQEEGT